MKLSFSSPKIKRKMHTEVRNTKKIAFLTLLPYLGYFGLCYIKFYNEKMLSQLRISALFLKICSFCVLSNFTTLVKVGDKLPKV